MPFQEFLIEYTLEDLKKIYNQWAEKYNVDLDDLIMKLDVYLKKTFQSEYIPFFIINKILSIAKKDRDFISFIIAKPAVALQPFSGLKYYEILKNNLKIVKEILTPEEFDYFNKFDKIKTFDDLVHFSFFLKKTFEKFEQRKTELDINKRTLYDETPTDKIYIIKTYNDAVFLGYGTEWCITQEHKYGEYSNNFDLYVIVPKNPRKYEWKQTTVIEKYLVAFLKKIYWDALKIIEEIENNIEIMKEEISKNNPEYINQLFIADRIVHFDRYIDAPKDLIDVVYEGLNDDYFEKINNVNYHDIIITFLDRMKNYPLERNKILNELNYTINIPLTPIYSYFKNNINLFVDGKTSKYLQYFDILNNIPIFNFFQKYTDEISFTMQFQFNKNAMDMLFNSSSIMKLEEFEEYLDYLERFKEIMQSYRYHNFEVMEIADEQDHHNKEIDNIVRKKLKGSKLESVFDYLISFHSDTITENNNYFRYELIHSLFYDDGHRLLYTLYKEIENLIYKKYKEYIEKNGDLFVERIEKLYKIVNQKDKIMDMDLSGFVKNITDYFFKNILNYEDKIKEAFGTNNKIKNTSSHSVGEQLFIDMITSDDAKSDQSQ